MTEPSEKFWENIYRELENPAYAQDFRDMVRSLSEGPVSSLLSDHFKSMADATEEELHSKLEVYREWLRANNVAGGIGDVQHYGDYAETVAGGQPIDDDPPLTFADLEGISTPDLTAIVEGLKHDSMDRVSKSIVDMVSHDDKTHPASLHHQRGMKISADDPDVVDDYQVDEPVTAIPLSMGSPRLRQPAPSPTAEAPGDVSTAHLAEIADLRKDKGVGPHPGLDWSKTQD